MARMHKEEEGRLRRQLTIAKVSDGVGNDSKYGVTPLRVRQETAVLMLMNSNPSGKSRNVWEIFLAI